MNDYFRHAWKNHYAAGAFIVDSMDSMEAVASVCAKAGLPAVMMAGMNTARFYSPKRYADMCRSVAADYAVPVYAHLDHCTDPQLLLQCAQAGFSSVMFDGSKLAFEENVAACAQLAEKCHELGVLLEGELGVIAGNEEHVQSVYSQFTDPAKAEEFIRRANLDALAISVGNAHGLYKGKPELHFDLLQDIADRCQAPLVLHGGTGIPAEDIRRAVSMGVCKINVGTELRQAYMKAVREYAQVSDGTAIGLSDAIRQTIAEAAAPYLENYHPLGGHV